MLVQQNRYGGECGYAQRTGGIADFEVKTEMTTGITTHPVVARWYFVALAMAAIAGSDFDRQTLPIAISPEKIPRLPMLIKFLWFLAQVRCATTT